LFAYGFTISAVASQLALAIKNIRETRVWLCEQTLTDEKNATAQWFCFTAVA